MEKMIFEHLVVWQKAIDLADIVIDICENINTERKHFRLIEQLESSATSVASNIAEGKGRYSKKEFVQYLYIARGSLFEVITRLTVFHRKKWVSEHDISKVRNLAEEINKMISSLVKAIRGSVS